MLHEPTDIPKPNKNEDPEQVRGDPLYSEIPERLQEFRENSVDDRVPEHRDSHASSSHEPSLEPTRSVDLCKHTVLKLTSRKTEVARSARGPKSQGPRAEDVLAESYFVQKILVIFITADHKVLSEGCDLETIIDMQSWCKTWLLNGSSRIRAKQKLLRKPKGASKSSWSRLVFQKSSFPFLLLVFLELCVMCCWLLVRRSVSLR